MPASSTEIPSVQKLQKCAVSVSGSRLPGRFHFHVLGSLASPSAHSLGFGFSLYVETIKHLSHEKHTLEVRSTGTHTIEHGGEPSLV